MALLRKPVLIAGVLAGIFGASVTFFYFDSNPLLALASGLLVALTFSGARPLFLVWLILTLLVPAWAGVTHNAFWEAGTLIALLVLPGLAFHLLTTRIEVNPGDGLILLLLLVITIGVAVGGSPTGQAANFFFLGLVPYSIVRFLAPALELDWVYRVLVAAMGLFALLAIIETATDFHPLTRAFSSSPTSFWSDIQYRSGISRSEVTFGHSLALGGCLAMAVPLALGCSFDRRFKAGLLALLLTGVVSTQSRSAMIAALLGLALFFFARRFERARDRMIIMGATLAVVMLTVAFFLFFYTDRESVDSVIHRSNLYTELLPDFNPVGIADGFSISGGSATLDGEEISVDSAILQMGLLYGWAAIALALTGLAIPAIRLLRGRASLPDITLTSQIPVLFTVWLITQYYPMVWLLAGLVVAATTVRRYSFGFRLLPERLLPGGNDRDQIQKPASQSDH